MGTDCKTVLALPATVPTKTADFDHFAGMVRIQMQDATGTDHSAQTASIALLVINPKTAKLDHGL